MEPGATSRVVGVRCGQIDDVEMDSATISQQDPTGFSRRQIALPEAIEYSKHVRLDQYSPIANERIGYEYHERHAGQVSSGATSWFLTCCTSAPSTRRVRKRGDGSPSSQPITKSVQRAAAAIGADTA